MKTSKVDIIRAWKDAEYRASLTEAQKSEMEQLPVMTEVELELIQGGNGRINSFSGECSSSGRGCHTVRGIYDQFGDWFLGT